MFFLNGCDTGMAGEKMGGLQRVGMSFPNNGNTTCVILCSVVVELLFGVFYFNKSIEEHGIHAAILLTEVPLTFGAVITKLRVSGHAKMITLKVYIVFWC